MKPLPHQDAALLRHSLQQIHTLLERRNWSAAYEALSVLNRDDDAWRQSPEFGEWCLLRSQSAVELAQYSEAVASARDAFCYFQLTTDNERIGLAQSIMGRGYVGLGDLKNALIQARDALATYRRVANERGMAQSHNELARIRFVRGEYSLAIEHLNDALELTRRLGDREGEARLLGNLGRIHLLVGRWPLAESVLVQALRCAESSGNKESVARNLLSLALVATLQHRFSGAGEHLDGVLACVEDASLVRERAIYHEYTGIWRYEQRHWVQAKESFRRALNIGRRLSDQNDLISQSLRGLAECEAALGDWAQSERLAREGLDVAIAIGERAEVGCLYRALAVALAHLNQMADASACMVKAQECLNAVGDVYELARCDLANAEVLSMNTTQTAATMDALQSAADRFASLNAAPQLRDARWLLVEAHVTAGDLVKASQLVCELTGAPDAATLTERQRHILDALTRQCLHHAVSEKNEFRLGGTPWARSLSEHPASDDLQQSLDFYRSRLAASRVILVEITSDGRRSGRVLSVSGADVTFASRVSAFVSGTSHQLLSVDTPQVFWSVATIPELVAYLKDESGAVPVSVITVPVELGPGSGGLLYADLCGSVDAQTGFSPRDLDFAVAFAEVIAWHSTRLKSERLFRDVQLLRDQVGRQCEFPSIITQNDAFREVLSRVRLILDADVSILLQGETGTGKDLLAKAIHYSSARRNGRFVSVNCAALPESLLENELFGAKRGAYTGADHDKQGLFEEADGGTFLLDEIGEMPLPIQAKLLRFLESKELTRLGDTKPRRIDVRVVSATNRDLTEEVERGTFRRDLFYRLSALSFNLPPLRGRVEDIPLLIDHFLAKIADETGRAVRIAPETIRVMCAFSWPGNVRELENELRKMVLLSVGNDVLTPDRLSHKFFENAPMAGFQAAETIPEHFRLYDQVAQIEQRYIIRALAEAGGVKKHAAEKLGIPESTLRLKIRQYSLDTD